MIRVTIGRKSKALLSHLTSDPSEESSETYEQSKQEDLFVFSWLIQNIKPTLAGNLTKYHTAKTLWDALVITYNSERDKLKTFNLHSSVSSSLATPIGGMMATRRATRIEERKEAKPSLPTPILIEKDIRTGAIIRRGTERKGLYYVDDVTRSGTVMLSHGTTEREAWLWHRRLGHPSTGYLHALFPIISFQLYPIANIAKGNLFEEAKAFALSMYSDEIPANTEQALKSKHLKDAMEEEIKALIKNNMWEKRVLPPGKKTVRYRWVVTIKYKLDGTIERYKVRLVAKGYTQTYGIDYSETFSPVAKINTMRVFIFVAANKGWPLHQFDVKNAFLHEELKEEIYMEAPHGFTNSFGEREVCLLKKSLYGLKQSHRAWFGRFTLAMKHYGFRQILRIIRYLKGTAGHGVLFKQNGHLETQLYTDADWARDKGDRRPPHVTLPWWEPCYVAKQETESGGPFKCRSRVPRDCKGITEVLWIRKLLNEIGYPPQEPSKVMRDNEAAIQISKNRIQHVRTKHIEIDRHFIKEKLEAEIITLPFVRSQDQVADILTKAVNERTLHECLGKLNFGGLLKGNYLMRSTRLMVNYIISFNSSKHIRFLS
nr:putative ribonuclease H-like domain-containing protein [Tanacetum cinerariifolium]